MLDDISVPLPLPAEQRKSVQEIELLNTETQRLATLYERKRAALEALRESLLKEAFAGNL